MTGVDAEKRLFSDAPAQASMRETSCPSSAAPKARVDCLIDLRYAVDAKAAAEARELYDTFDILPGLDDDQVTTMGYRGTLHLVPWAPVGEQRRHLDWILAGAKDFDAFFRALDPQSAHTVRYRWRPIELRFMRSYREKAGLAGTRTDARTPSAYAKDWQVAWNVTGSLHRNETAVRETLFHEIFHLNDADDWSVGALGPIFDAVVAKCGTTTACLAPYSPNDTQVVGGTYYSFQPGNGVKEYAAELATRYYKEHRAAQKKQAEATRRPFKCGPPENARAWKAMVDTFFDGIDATPACGK
jgi:hypothetical protein